MSITEEVSSATIARYHWATPSPSTQTQTKTRLTYVQVTIVVEEVILN